MVNALIFDIETIPDLEGGRKILGLENSSDEEVAEAMFTVRRMQVGHTFLPVHLQKVVAISAVWHSDEHVRVKSLGTIESSEKDLLESFFSVIDRSKPILISWNGVNFDLPVLQYRSLIQGVQAPQYWENGETDSNFRYNNYLNRYHYRHLDLMDVLSSYSPRAYAPLDQISKMMDLPGKISLHGSEVYEAYKRGELQAIREYCELDVLNTYLVFLRFEWMRGHLTDTTYTAFQHRLRDHLESTNILHFKDFLNNWGIDPSSFIL